jgi:PAS domain S-box-containing protein
MKPLLNSMENAGREPPAIVPFRLAILGVLSALVVLTTIYCLTTGIQIVFPHLYYVPIILAAYWYQRNGVLYAAVMGFIYLSLVTLFIGYNPNNIVAAFTRFVAFIVIAGVTAILSLQISEKHRAQELSEQKFRTIWENVQAAIIVVDAQSHTILAANPEAERLFGCPEREIIGRTCHAFICPAEVGKCPVTDLNQTVDHSERILLTRNGERLPVMKTVSRASVSGRDVLVENFIPLNPAELSTENND